MYGLSQTLAGTITQIDGVVTARVHIVLQEDNPLTGRYYPSSAAVFIKYRPGANVVSAQPRIKDLVTNSIEGLSYDKVTVAFFEGDVPDLEVVAAHQQQYASASNATRTMVIVIAIILLLIVAVGAGTYWYLQQQKLGSKNLTDKKEGK